MDYEVLATVANLEKYLGFLPTRGSGVTSQPRKRPTHETSKKPIVEATKKVAADKGKDKGKAGEPSKKFAIEKGKRKVEEAFPRTHVVARVPTPMTPLRLIDKPEELPSKKRKTMPLNPQDAFARVMGALVEEFKMPATNTLLDLMDILGIPYDDAHPIAARPLNVVPTELMAPSSSDSSEAPDVGQILEKVSAQRSGSPQKSEGRAIEVENDVRMELTSEDKTTPGIVSGAKAKLILIATLTKIEVEPEVSPAIMVCTPTLQENLPQNEVEEAKAGS
ncbi:hypothetical protein FH972_025614 [Carpinus fangiana]|uniref:Uncharacterized protein n=1 Tax=Carpinus fangiana TaxID=176857 RepID=A0A5N6L1Y4_9ROSI|nr:hypothetical protein FH972_025614 [Carpinus fangiana]